MLVPLYADFGKGWIKLGSATMIANNSLEITNLKLPMAPKRVAICALNDVLAAIFRAENNDFFLAVRAALAESEN